MSNIFVYTADQEYPPAWAHLLKERGYRVDIDRGAGRPARDCDLVIADLQPSQPLMMACAAVNRLRASGVNLLVLMPGDWTEQHTQAMELRPRQCAYKPMDCASVVRLVDMICSSREHAAMLRDAPALSAGAA